MLEPRDRWILRIVSLLAMLGAFNILIYGEIGAPTTESTFQFRAWERLYFIVPALISIFFFNLSNSKNEDDNRDD